VKLIMNKTKSGAHVMFKFFIPETFSYLGPNMERIQSSTT
jgi:hypothetical protein